MKHWRFSYTTISDDHNFEQMLAMDPLCLSNCSYYSFFILGSIQIFNIWTSKY